MFIAPLPSNGRVFLFHYSGSHPSCHSILKKLDLSWDERVGWYYLLQPIRKSESQSLENFNQSFPSTSAPSIRFYQQEIIRIFAIIPMKTKNEDGEGNQKQVWVTKPRNTSAEKIKNVHAIQILSV
jgi:hypothetical protein